MALHLDQESDRVDATIAIISLTPMAHLVSVGDETLLSMVLSSSFIMPIPCVYPCVISCYTRNLNISWQRGQLFPWKIFWLGEFLCPLPLYLSDALNPFYVVCSFCRWELMLNNLHCWGVVHDEYKQQLVCPTEHAFTVNLLHYKLFQWKAIMDIGKQR